MLIQQEANDETGSFYIDESGKRVAELTYTIKTNSTLVIQHTEVDGTLQGKNIGYELVEKAVAFAREQQLKIFPACSFAAQLFKKQTEFSDVLNQP